MLNNCAMIRELVLNGARLIDVRSTTEFSMHKLKGSENIPLETIKYMHENGELSLDKKLLLFCNTGRRSSAVESYLRNKGYDAVNIGMQSAYKYCKEL